MRLKGFDSIDSLNVEQETPEQPYLYIDYQMIYKTGYFIDFYITSTGYQCQLLVFTKKTCP